MEIGEIYFWTATIRNWEHLLMDNSFKKIIIDSLEFLSKKECIDVFGLVIMPNHVHLIWRINKLNGKQSPQTSFLKFTAHRFKEKLIKEDASYLKKFALNDGQTEYQFWKRDPLAIPLYTMEVAYQKLDYMHDNPLRSSLQLAKDPCDYVYSSASYYERGNTIFTFLKDLREEF